MIKKEKLPSEETITTTPFRNSKKIYVKGKLHPINVAMREIEISDGISHRNGKAGATQGLTVYDTSGPYTDTGAKINLKSGLNRLRESWILERGDVEMLPEISSVFGKERLYRSDLDYLRFEHIKKPLKAKAGKNVTQMHYARQGMVTPEMEYIAIRENQRYDAEHQGMGLREITPEFVRKEIALF